ncbi:hypothetical protein [Thermoflavimicrobium dichotomicum]|uniref:Uncharacterized protein n=1 Tax=Thermoflavimicrobium dichotomicum TaxID=46223 RepID=A0A1I3P5N2_9BACL|nr:hypothetical protein [Thermoflavimicrobium dichotomicum]SFJ16660.1 hypothetical protein SAMN05421852_10595 [Thermoflavimicrobium dichotomicum]
MSLNLQLVNSPPTTPEVVREAVRLFAQPRETYNIYNIRALSSGNIYHYATFFYGKAGTVISKDIKGILIVNANGMVPSFYESIEPMSLIFNADGRINVILTKCHKLTQRPMWKWNKINQLLDKLHPYITKSANHELLHLYTLYKQIPDTMFRTQNELNEIVEKGKRLLAELSTDYLVTEDFEHRVRQVYNRMMYCIADQLKIQTETYQERQRFFQILRKSIPYFDLLGKWHYYYLRLHDLEMKVTDRIRNEHERFMADITNEKANQRQFEEALRCLRNPKE